MAHANSNQQAHNFIIQKSLEYFSLQLLEYT